MSVFIDLLDGAIKLILMLNKAGASDVAQLVDHLVGRNTVEQYQDAS